MQVFIAWTENDIRVLSTAGIDLGQKPETERITVGKAAQWKWEGATQEDIEKAEQYAMKHCTDRDDAGVLVYAAPEPDTAKAKRRAESDIVKLRSPESAFSQAFVLYL